MIVAVLDGNCDVGIQTHRLFSVDLCSPIASSAVDVAVDQHHPRPTSSSLDKPLPKLQSSLEPEHAYELVAGSYEMCCNFDFPYLDEMSLLLDE